MLTVRWTPATSTRASRLASSTTSMMRPGIARHILGPLPSPRREIRDARESYVRISGRSKRFDRRGLLKFQMPVPDKRAAIERRLLRDTAYVALCDAIVDGTLAPGETLHDDELCAWLGLSRTPIRGALVRLEDEGLVECCTAALHPRDAARRPVRARSVPGPRRAARACDRARRSAHDPERPAVAERRQRRLRASVAGRRRTRGVRRRRALPCGLPASGRQRPRPAHDRPTGTAAAPARAPDRAEPSGPALGGPAPGAGRTRGGGRRGRSRLGRAGQLDDARRADRARAERFGPN